MSADRQESEWREYERKARAAGRCPDSGLPIHSCHRVVCDCFESYSCEACNPKADAR